MTTIYVLNKDGKPLMPTTRCGHVRHLLGNKKARVVCRNPFTVQLNYETDDVVQPLYLGIDPGRTNIGLAVVKEDGEPVIAVQVETRNKDIPKLMQARKESRNKHRYYGRRTKRQRRAKAAGTASANPIERKLPGCSVPIECKLIKNKEARFNNRIRPEGWLTPTANHLLETHINVVKKLQKLLPITDVVLELNKFAFMALDNPYVQKWEFQQGPLCQKGSVEKAVYEEQHGMCLFCKEAIAHYHHVVPRHKGGSETLDNRVGLCKKHHHLVHTEQRWADKLASKKAGMNKKYGALSVLNQIIPKLTEVLSRLYPGHTYVTSGLSTHYFRLTCGIEKDHYLDAYCIACSALKGEEINVVTNFEAYKLKQFRRHDRQACHKEMLNRAYLLDGKMVAANRHKAIEQKSDSLEQFRATHTEQEVSKLTVKPHPAQYKDLHRFMPGGIFAHNGGFFVLKGSKGRSNGSPDYYVDTNGVRHLYSKCTNIKNNSGLVFI